MTDIWGEYKSFAQRTLLIIIASSLLNLNSIFLMPILTKNISIYDYSIWIQVSVTQVLLPLLVMLGLPFTMVRYLNSAKNDEEIRECFYSIAIPIVIMALFSSSCIYILSNYVAEFLFDKNLFAANILALIILLECLDELFLTYFRARQQIKKYSCLVILKSILLFSLIFLSESRGYGLFGALFCIPVTQAIVFFLSSSIVIHEIGFKVPKFSNLKEYLSFGLPTVPANLSSWIINSSNRYLISIFLGIIYVGYYSPGYILGNTINIIVLPLSFMLPAYLSKHYDNGNNAHVNTVINYCIKYFLIIAIPSVFGISLLSKEILTLIATPEIASNGYFITPVIAISGLFFGVRSLMAQIIIIKKKTNINAMIWLFTAGLNFALNLIIIPYFGLLGASTTTLMAYAISLILTYWYSRNYLQLNMNNYMLLKLIISSIIMSSIIILANPSGMQEIIIVVIACATIYLINIYLLGCFSRTELQFFKALSCIKRTEVNPSEWTKS